jgi:hypothetical protein
MTKWRIINKADRASCNARYRVRFLSQIEEGMTSAEGQMQLINELLAGDTFTVGVKQTAQQETFARIKL